MNEIEKEYSASYALVKLIEMAALGSGLVGGLLGVGSVLLAGLLFMQATRYGVSMFMGGMVFTGSAVGMVTAGVVTYVLLRAMAGMLKAVLDTAVATQFVARRQA